MDVRRLGLLLLMTKILFTAANAPTSGHYYSESRCMLRSTAIPTTNENARLFTTPLFKPAAAAPCVQLLTKEDEKIGNWILPTSNHQAAKVNNILETKNLLTALLKGKALQISQLDTNLGVGRFIVDRYYYHFEVLKTAGSQATEEYNLCVSSDIATTPENCYTSLQTVISGAAAGEITISINESLVPRDQATSKSILGNKIHILAVDIKPTSWTFLTIPLDFDNDADPPVRVMANPALDFTYAKEIAVNKTCINYLRKLEDLFGRITSNPKKTFQKFLRQTLEQGGLTETAKQNETMQVVIDILEKTSGKVLSRPKRFLGLFSSRTSRLEEKQKLHRKALLTLRENVVRTFIAQNGAAHLLQTLSGESAAVQTTVVKLALKATHDRNLVRMAYLQLAEGTAYTAYLNEIMATTQSSLSNALQLFDLLVHTDAGRPACFFHQHMVYCRKNDRAAYVDHTGQLPELHFFADLAQLEPGFFPYCLPTRLGDGTLAISRYHGQVLRKLGPNQLGSASFVVPKHCFSDIQTLACKAHYKPIDNETGLPTIEGMNFAPTAEAGGLRLMTMVGAIELKDALGQPLVITESPKTVGPDKFPLSIGRRKLTREMFTVELADAANPSLYMRHEPPEGWESRVDLRPPPMPKSSTVKPPPLSITSIGDVFSSEDPAKQAAGIAAATCAVALAVFAICCIYCSCRHSKVCADLRALWSAIHPLCCYLCQACSCACNRPTDLGAHFERLQKVTGQMLRTQEADSVSVRSRTASLSVSQTARNEDALSFDYGRAPRRSARIQTKPQDFLDEEGEELVQLNPLPTAPTFPGNETP